MVFVPLSRDTFERAKGKSGVKIRFKDGFNLTGCIVDVRDGEFDFKTGQGTSTIDMADISAVLDPNGRR